MEIMTRNDAALRGLKRYNNGQPCKRGHYSDRYVINNGCIACATASAKPFRSVYGGDIVPYAPTKPLQTCKVLTAEHRAGLERYLQECIFAYLRGVKDAYGSDDRIRIMRAIADITEIVTRI